MRWWDWKNFLGLDMESSQNQCASAVVALGGGGARGLAHLGVMQAVGECGIHTERIVGVSMGSLVGAMCAIEPDIHKVQAKAIEFVHSPIFRKKQQQLFGSSSSHAATEDIGMFAWYDRLKQFISAHRRFNRAVTAPSLMSKTLMWEAIEHLLPDVDLKDLPTPLSVVCVDLLSGHRIVLENGSLRDAVHASTAIPGFFPPVKIDDMLLCDIGVFDSLPNTIARSYGGEMTIGVDVGQERSTIKECDTALDVMMRMQDIGEQLLRRHVRHTADIVIRPDVGHVPWFDFRNPEVLIEAGRRAGHEALFSYAAPEALGHFDRTQSWNRGSSAEANRLSDHRLQRDVG
jgi:NTE family protein